MGNLPRERAARNRCVYESGVDFAASFLINNGRLRKRVVIKTYLCIFICFWKKAVHLRY